MAYMRNVLAFFGRIFLLSLLRRFCCGDDPLLQVAALQQLRQGQAILPRIRRHLRRLSARRDPSVNQPRAATVVAKFVRLDE